MQKRWLIKQSPEQTDIEDLASSLKVTPLMADLLLRRGLTSADDVRSYFKPSLEELHDPFLMKNMAAAVDRLKEAIKNDELILLYGDYDVDGTTAVALMYAVLSPLARVAWYIPDRYEEGYGLSVKGVDHAKTLGAALLITLDCGIKEVERIAYAQSLGIETIVCDHHTPGAELPAGIVLDPKQKECPYPYKELSGCGVGFKLLEGLFQDKGWPFDKLEAHLDLVAISIGADIVPVTGENRVLCKKGLEVLNHSPREGLKALISQAEKTFPLDLTNVVFIIAPRINAAGRLESGAMAVDLLLEEHPRVAARIAAEIDSHNQERRLLDARITGEALELIDSDQHFAARKSTVVFQEDWHKGVVGIVASRLIEKHYRPTIVLTQSKGVATGSARSVDNFNVYEAISACEHLLTQFGGHHHAAGLTLPLENVDAFRDAFDAIVRERITRMDEDPELVIDHEIRLHQLFVAGESIGQVPRLMRMLQEMEPFGPENSKPVFCVRAVYASTYKVLKEAHLKIDLMDPEYGIVLPAIAFNMADKIDLVASGCAFDCAFTLETNTWKDRTTLQLQIKDIREA